MTHIISSNSDTKTVNEPIVQAIDNNLLEGKNIDWINMWKNWEINLQGSVAKKKLTTTSRHTKISVLFS